jgi:O-antigen/teichoic acid export membrane protein
MAGIGLSSTVVRFIFGSAYMPMVRVLNILLISACFGIIASPGSSVYYATGRQGYMVKIGLLIAVQNIIMNLSLIPSFGAFGAAIANSTSQITAILIGTFIICRLTTIRFPIEDLIKISCSGVCMLVWIYLSSYLIKGIPHAIFSFSTSLLIYVALLFSLKVVTRADVELFSVIREKIPTTMQPSYNKLICILQRYAT